MAGFVHFTDEQKDRARQTDIVSLLERQGEKVRRAGSEYEWLDGTAKVSIRGNLWFHQYEREGGNAIDFVKRFFDKSYTEAMQFLLNGEGGELKTAPPVEKKADGIFEMRTIIRVFNSDMITRICEDIKNMDGISNVSRIED